MSNEFLIARSYFSDNKGERPYLKGYLLCESNEVQQIFDDFIYDVSELIIDEAFKANYNTGYLKSLKDSEVYTGWCFDSRKRKCFKRSSIKKEDDVHPIFFVFHIRKPMEVWPEGESRKVMALRCRNFDVLDSKDLKTDKIVLDVWPQHFNRIDYGYNVMHIAHEMSHVLDVYRKDDERFDEDDIAYTGVFGNAFFLSMDKEQRTVFKECLYVFSRTEQKAVRTAIESFIEANEAEIVSRLSAYHYDSLDRYVYQFIRIFDGRCNIKAGIVRKVSYALADALNSDDYMFPVLLARELVKKCFIKDVLPNKLFSDDTLCEMIRDGIFEMDDDSMKALLDVMKEIRDKMDRYLEKVFKVVYEKFRELEIFQKLPFTDEEEERKFKCSLSEYYPEADDSFVHGRFLNEYYRGRIKSKMELFRAILFETAFNIGNHLND